MNGNLKLSAKASQIKLADPTSPQVLITGQSKGTIVRTVTIKATGSTQLGLVRFFIQDTEGMQFLLKEVRIPAMENCASAALFAKIVGWPLVNYRLPPDYSLCVALSAPNPINVSADGYDWSYAENNGTMQNTAIGGCVMIDAANPFVDGSGEMKPIIMGSEDGVLIKSLTIKALEGTQQGIVRFFIGEKGGSSNAPQLLKEVRIPATNPGSGTATFSNIVGLPVSGFRLPPGYTLFGATEKATPFNLIAEAMVWSYPV